MEWKYVLLVLIGLCGLFIVVALLVRPIAWILRLVSCAAVGTVLILIANVALDQVGLRIAINPATVLAAGILQIPGTIFLVVLKYLFA